MLRQTSVLALGLLLAALLGGCKPVTAPSGGASTEPAATTEATIEATAEATAEATEAAGQGSAGLANPASVFCADNDGELEIRDETGGQVGYCVFDDGSECEEWAYMRGECAAGESRHGESKSGEAIGMPNPASVFCADHGGTLEMRQDKSGGEYGMCVFSDASECEEWAYYRGECAPGQPRFDANMPNPASANCADHGGTVEIHQDDGGGEYGMCVFDDDSECEEWAYLRGSCHPGDHHAAHE